MWIQILNSEANDEGNVAEPAVLAAAKALLPRLIRWTKRDRVSIFTVSDSLFILTLLFSKDKLFIFRLPDCSTQMTQVLKMWSPKSTKNSRSRMFVILFRRLKIIDPFLQKLVHESSPDRSTKKKRKRTSASKRNSAGQGKLEKGNWSRELFQILQIIAIWLLPLRCQIANSSLMRQVQNWPGKGRLQLWRFAFRVPLSMSTLHLRSGTSFALCKGLICYRRPKFLYTIRYTTIS